VKSEPETRFWKKVDRTGECWVWIATCDPYGYGRFWLDGRMAPAHRVSFAMTCGPIEPGMQLDHICRNRRCVKPAHLRQVTPYWNRTHNTASPLVAIWFSTHCSRGHPFDLFNTKTRMRDGKMRRECRECRRLTQMARRA